MLRWEGAFSEAKRNHIARLSMNFGAAEIDLAGGIGIFRELIEGFHKAYCPDTVFEPELTYPSNCNVALEAGKIDGYDAYTIVVPDSVEVVIFNNGIGASQTANIPFDGSSHVYRALESTNPLNGRHDYTID